MEMDNIAAYHQRLLELLTSGEIADKKELLRRKIALCRELKLETVPPNSATLALADENTLAQVKDLLRRKPVRTLSGVAVVAVMTSPAPCPHGKCTYCPGGVENNSPQSYTGKEPAARRGAYNEFDPFRQVRARIAQLTSIGHPTDKIDLIIMGGTFTSRLPEYQQEFVKRCFDAMNEEDCGSLEEAHARNENAPHRCIGMTIETRPDGFDLLRSKECMRLGTTRVEFGVQILDDDILRSVNRGHGTKEVVEATRVAKDSGLKVCYHVMPGLPGSDPDKDLDRFRLLFDDERFRPDMLKIYPTLVVKGTKLYEQWQRGEFVPYTTAQATEVVAAMKAIAPRYVRIQRIQRDIPVQLIEAGVDKGHLRELARARMKEQGKRCRCIRCREVGLNRIQLDSAGGVGLNHLVYRASGGREDFISFDLLEQDALVGYVRLRMPGEGSTAHVRELKVFGQMARFDQEGREWQHKGFGKELMQEAERTAQENGYSTLKVTSGVGVRRYYSAIGYVRDGVYMSKQLAAK
jgi:elongator complex protein 3